MNILVAHPREAKTYEKVLSALGHQVELVDDPESLLAAVASGNKYDVAAVPIGKRFESTFSALADSSPHIYFIGLVPRLTQQSYQEAYKAGVDDVIGFGACAAEIAGRVDAPERIRRWKGSEGGEQAFAISDLKVWQTADVCIAAEIGQMLGLEFTVCEGDDAAVSQSAEIILNLVEEGQEAAIGVGVGTDSMEAISQMLFGEVVHTDIFADAVREFANCAGGVVKRAAIDEGHTFSLGLPKDCQQFAVPAGAKHVRLTSGEISLSVWLQYQTVGKERVTAAHLEEGMVLAKDVNGAGGVLLFPAGRVLTHRTIERLVSIVGSGALFEVTRAA